MLSDLGIQPSSTEIHHFCEHKKWDDLEWQKMPGGAHTLLDHTNLAFDERCMFICCGTKFDLHFVEVVMKELKFTIHEDVLQLEASFGISGLDFSECCEDGGRLVVW